MRRHQRLLPLGAEPAPGFNAATICKYGNSSHGQTRPPTRACREQTARSQHRGDGVCQLTGRGTLRHLVALPSSLKPATRMRSEYTYGGLKRPLLLWLLLHAVHEFEFARPVGAKRSNR